MTIGDRIYEIVSFRRKGEEGCVNREVIITRSKELDASLGEDDCRHIMEHQEEIPAIFYGKAVFIFTNWLNRRYKPNCFACLGYWYNEGPSWTWGWFWRDPSQVSRHSSRLHGQSYLLRRIK